MSISLAATGAAPAPPNPQPKSTGPTDVQVISIKLSKGNNAADIAAALKGNVPQIVSVTALDNNRLSFVLDVSDPKKALDEKKLGGWVDSLSLFKSPAAVEFYTKTLPPESGNATDVAAKLSNIPGITSIVPIGNTTLLFLLDQTPDPRFPSTPRDTSKLKRAIDDILANVRIQAPNFYMLPFPLGTGKNCDIATALAKQIPGILNISPVGSTRLAFELDSALSKDQQDQLKHDIGEYVRALAEPVTPPSPNTETYVQRLYYDHDPVTAATIIHASFPEVNASVITPDTVVLSETIPSKLPLKRDPLEDARQLIAKIDQPRPQISLETWSIQVSADDESHMENSAQQIEKVTSKYNEVIATSTQRGWQFLTHKPLPQGPFEDYLTDQTYSTGKCCNQKAVTEDYSTNRSGYALGYTTLFTPLPRNLAFWLIRLSVAENPQWLTNALINTMETGDRNQSTLQAFNDHQTAESDKSCQERDADGYATLVSHGRPLSLQLECARHALSDGLFRPKTNAIGPFRAAVADFLFQYKMLVQYRNEFQPFSFSQAAAALDMQLNPIVNAFTTDLEAFQKQIKEEIESSGDSKNHSDKLFNDKHVSYAASGIVSLKVVGGNQASVQTLTQNYFDATPPVRLGDIAAAIKSIGTGSTTSSGTVTPPVLPGFLTANMTANEAVGALAAIQALTRTPVSARIGKGLTLQATAYTLAGASGAEMDVQVESNENGAELLTAATSSNLSSTTAQSDDLASRVADHKVATRVRVDSLNLFSLSTMQSVLARGKAPWRPIDPWLEIPVLGELVRVPRKPAVTFHRSFIFINALVVPTSADLASQSVEGDVVSDNPEHSKFRRTRQTSELEAKNKENPVPLVDDEVFGLIHEYHRRMMRWIAEYKIDGSGNVKNPKPAPSLLNTPSVR